ncbi:hypothetical protein, conserved [Trypanosoma cruzi]|uniref:Replication factor Mcm10 C-terminal domain-containing protein n=2 Tax=Trypanosoma cruzi TaxID=5693 RepID=Q4DBE5_TRYCC|nr:hypothetical protein, conserved [Trypanosoma cruzi]EAN89844.1 hypothetical protein, conserved [Trypanosoma cruzi]|eukprot:XP_811695.1 hypothetical protein [Trypanosoma cruzi strain CL Brener]
MTVFFLLVVFLGVARYRGRNRKGRRRRRLEMTRNEANDNVDDDEDLFAVFNTPEPAGDLLAAPAALRQSDSFFGGGRSVSVTEALSKSASSPSLSIMHVVCASTQDGCEMGSVTRQPPAERVHAAAVREPNSGINIRHSTKSCEQLPLVLVEYPYSTFIEMRRSLATAGTPPLLTVIGVVIRRTDPKQKNGKGAYGIISLWNMRGPFPTPQDELSILIVGSAFDAHYTKLAIGLVLALSSVQRMEGRKGTLSGNTQAENTTLTNSNRPGANSSNVCSTNLELLKVVKGDQIRVLGYAVDLRTCEGTQQRSGERCNRIVNGALSKFCSNHVANLRRVARGKASSPSTTTPQKPLRSNLSSTTFRAGVTRVDPALTNPTGVIASKKALQSMVRQQPGFLTVKGSCGLPTTTPAGSDVVSAAGAYAGVVPGGALSVTGICRDVGRVFRSPQALGVTARGRAVLAAAVDQEDAKERQRLLQLALKPSELGAKHPRNEGTSTPKSPRTTVAEDVEAVREQYAPLTGGSSSSFAAMRFNGFEEVRRHRQDYQHHVITKRANGTTSSIVSVVEQHLRGDGVLAKTRASIAQEETSHQKNTASVSKSLLGTVAGSIESVNDGLRATDERRKFEQRMERRLMQEKALEALVAVTEQKVKGIYCRQCERWYLRRNERCKMLQHVLETRATIRRFIECEHCGYKTSLLGDVRPSKMIPRCPRCCADAMWKASNAAPEMAAPRKDPPPL